MGRHAMFTEWTTQAAKVSVLMTLTYSSARVLPRHRQTPRRRTQAYFRTYTLKQVS